MSIFWKKDNSSLRHYKHGYYLHVKNIDDQRKSRNRIIANENLTKIQQCEAYGFIYKYLFIQKYFHVDAKNHRVSDCQLGQF